MKISLQLTDDRQWDVSRTARYGPLWPLQTQRLTGQKRRNKLCSGDGISACKWIKWGYTEIRGYTASGQLVTASLPVNESRKGTQKLLHCDLWHHRSEMGAEGMGTRPQQTQSDHWVRGLMGPASARQGKKAEWGDVSQRPRLVAADCRGAHMEGRREGRREGWRDRLREGGRERQTERGKDGWTEGGRDRGMDWEREGWREEGRGMGGRHGGRGGGRAVTVSTGIQVKVQASYGYFITISATEFIYFFALNLTPQGQAMPVPQRRAGKKVGTCCNKHFATPTRLVHVTDTNCPAQNGSSHGHISATFKCKLLTNQTTNGPKNCHGRAPISKYFKEVLDPATTFRGSLASFKGSSLIWNSSWAEVFCIAYDALLSLLQLSSGLIHTGSNLCQLDSWYIPDLTCSARQLIHTGCTLHQPDSWNSPDNWYMPDQTCISWTTDTCQIKLASAWQLIHARQLK